MKKLIASLKNGFINVPILLISTSDAGFKYDGEYKTEKAVPHMVEKQKEIAKNNNIAFFNLFNSMGGENTIVHWVEGDTVLAYKDYTHLNNRGSKKVAEILYNCILNSQKKF
jgi:lysophospholipase L1-like esterase